MPNGLVSFSCPLSTSTTPAFSNINENSFGPTQSPTLSSYQPLTPLSNPNSQLKIVSKPEQLAQDPMIVDRERETIPILKMERLEDQRRLVDISSGSRESNASHDPTRKGPHHSEGMRRGFSSVPDLSTSVGQRSSSDLQNLWDRARPLQPSNFNYLQSALSHQTTFSFPECGLVPSDPINCPPWLPSQPYVVDYASDVVSAQHSSTNSLSSSAYQPPFAPKTHFKTLSAHPSLTSLSLASVGAPPIIEFKTELETRTGQIFVKLTAKEFNFCNSTPKEFQVPQTLIKFEESSLTSGSPRDSNPRKTSEENCSPRPDSSSEEEKIPEDPHDLSQNNIKDDTGKAADVSDPLEPNPASQVKHSHSPEASELDQSHSPFAGSGSLSDEGGSITASTVTSVGQSTGQSVESPDSTKSEILRVAIIHEKHVLLARLMKTFYENILAACVYRSAPTDSSRPQTSGCPQLFETQGWAINPPKQPRRMKRQRNEEDDESDQEDNRKGGKKAKLVSSEYDGGRRFACPFHKYDPATYRVNSLHGAKYRACEAPGFMQLSHVRYVNYFFMRILAASNLDDRQHLKRKHKMPTHCPRCWTVMSSQSLVAHLTKDKGEICEIVPGYVEGIDQEKMDLIHHDSFGDSWKKIYSIIFPGAEAPSPCKSRVALTLRRVHTDEKRCRNQALKL